MYWETLHTQKVGEAVSKEVSEEEKENFLKRKQDQLNAYRQDMENNLKN